MVRMHSCALPLKCPPPPGLRNPCLWIHSTNLHVTRCPTNTSHQTMRASKTASRPGRDQVWPNPSLAKSGYQVWPDQVWPRPSLARPSLAKTSLARPSLAKTKFGADQVRDNQYSPCFCEGVAGRRRRRLHTNTAYVRLLFQQAFMWSRVWVFRV